MACGALLARAGWGVSVLEREAVLGGAVRTEELTEPGFLHDVFSAWHPLWVGGAAPAELGDEWRGVLESFLPNADLAFGILGTELWSKDGLALALKAFRRFGARG